LLIELVNIKANKPAVSITSLFLLTLLMVVYVGAFFTGKADGSEAFSLLSIEAKEELKEHKLLGTYMVYATSILFFFKILSMLVKKNWSRNIFLVVLVIFIAVAFKQGRDGGELVYEYGINVKAATELQDRIDEMQYDIDDLRAELKKAKESSSAQGTDATQSVNGKVEESTTQPVEANHAEAEDKTTHETATSENNSESTPAHESKETVPMHESAPAATETVPANEHNIPKPTGHKSSVSDEPASENTTPVHIPTH
jgi:uncharacterized membrane protein